MDNGETICLALGRAMTQEPNISARPCKSMFDTYQQVNCHYGTGHHAAHDPGANL